MPLYDYQCPKCHQTFDALRPMDSVPAPCPHCGTESPRVYLASSLPGVVMRPAGYNDKPGDKGYYRIPEERHPHAPNRYKEIQSWQFNSRPKNP